MWSLTLSIFGSAVYPGIADWNRLAWPWLTRWGVGVSLIGACNIVVWCGVAQIGLNAASGHVAGLRRRMVTSIKIIVVEPVVIYERAKNAGSERIWPCSVYPQGINDRGFWRSAAPKFL